VLKQREIGNLLKPMKAIFESRENKAPENYAAVRRFVKAQHTYNAALIDEGQWQESEACLIFFLSNSKRLAMCYGKSSG